MTIKDIEIRSGIPRANIRFYEAQGLISPARGENGYRDYSEAELEMLLRIKLLRSLEISIDEIKSLISGEKELSPMLEEHISLLAQKQDSISRSRELCQLMRDDSVSFHSLDAARYLDFYSQRQSSIAEALRADTMPKVPHPFRRWAARSVDSGIYLLLVYTLLTLFGVNIGELGSAGRFLIDFTLVVLTLCLEPILLHHFGTTPGKWIFGIYITDSSGEKPSLYTGFYRYWDILRCGYGFYIPFYSLYRQYKSMMACLDGEDLPWEGDTVISIRDTRSWRIAAWLAAELAYIAAIGLLVFVGTMPSNIGKLTIEEFAENYNDYAEDYNLALYLSTGNNEAIPYYKSVIDLSSADPFISFTTEDGVISQVRLSKTNHLRTDTYQTEITLAALSFVRAQPGARLTGAPLNEMLEFMSAHPYEDFSYSVCGVEILCDYEYDGYILNSFGQLQETTADYDERYCSVTFTMTLE